MKVYAIGERNREKAVMIVALRFIYEIFFTRELQPQEFKRAIELNSGENFTCHPDCPLIPLAGSREGTPTRVTRLFDSALCAIPEAVLDSIGKEDWEPSEKKKKKKNEDSEGTPRVNKGGNGVNKKQPPRKDGRVGPSAVVCACIYTCTPHVRTFREERIGVQAVLKCRRRSVFPRSLKGLRYTKYYFYVKSCVFTCE